MAQRHLDENIAVDGLDLARRFEAGRGDAELNVDEGAADVDLGALVEELGRAYGPAPLDVLAVRRLGQLAVEVLADDLPARWREQQVRRRRVEHPAEDAVRREQLVDRRPAHLAVDDAVLGGDVLPRLHLDDGDDEAVVGSVDDEEIRAREVVVLTEVEPAPGLLVVEAQDDAVVAGGRRVAKRLDGDHEAEDALDVRVDDLP